MEITSGRRNFMTSLVMLECFISENFVKFLFVVVELLSKRSQISVLYWHLEDLPCLAPSGVHFCNTLPVFQSFQRCLIIAEIYTSQEIIFWTELYLSFRRRHSQKFKDNNFLRDRFIRSYLPILKQDAQTLDLFKLSPRATAESSLVLLRPAYWKAACSKQAEHIKQQKKQQVLSAPWGNLVPSNVYQRGTVYEGQEQPGNKAGKEDTTAVTTWAEKLLRGLRKTVVTIWASLSKN